MSSKKTTDLTRFGALPVDLGKTLIEQAQAKERAALGEQAVSSVRELLRTIEDRKRMITDSEIVIARAQRRLEAIEAGEFTVRRDGSLQYNDAENNRFITDGL